jgi:hypothetical protein
MVKLEDETSHFGQLFNWHKLLGIDAELVLNTTVDTPDMCLTDKAGIDFASMV